MKKLILCALSVLCMQSVFAKDVKEDSKNHDNSPANIEVAYKVDIKKVSDSKESNYSGHVVSGKISYFNSKTIVGYVFEKKCKKENDCDSVKGFEDEGVDYIVDIVKPRNSKEDLLVNLQVNDKELVNKRKLCDGVDSKDCVDLFDINILNFKEAIRMKDGQSKTLKYNNVSYTITINRE